MFSVIVPFVLLLAVVFIKKIPYIGGEIRFGLIIASLSAFILGGVYSPVLWVQYFFYGVDKISWVLFLILLGGIFAELLHELNAVETVLDVLRSSFGRTPKGMIIVIMVTLCLAGSLLGDANASCTIIGILGIQILLDMGFTGEQACATLVMGATLGSIMPPITQALFLSSSLMGLKSPDPVIKIGYFTAGFGLLICIIYVSRWVKIKKLPDELMPEKTARETLKAGWKSLVPITILVIIIILNSIFGLKPLAILDPIFNFLAHIPVIKGISYNINKYLLFCIFITLFYKPIRQKGLKIVKRGASKTVIATSVLLCAGLMIGAFYNSGQIELVQQYALKLNADMLKIGGGIAMTMMGMLTGSQSTAQTTIFTTFGPALQAIGVNPVHASLAGAHLAMSGQGLPPADLLTFVVAGLVGGFLGRKVDPLKSMIYSSFMCVYFFIVGMMFLYI